MIGLLALICLTNGECVHLEFGRPLDPPLSRPERMRRILADYFHYRDDLWTLGSDAIRTESRRALESGAGQFSEVIPAAKALGSLGRPFEVKLVQGLLRNPSAEVQLAAIQSLGQTGDPTSIPLIRPFLSRPDRTFRREAIVAFGKFADPSLLSEMEAAAGRDREYLQLVENGRRRIAAIQAQDPRALIRALIETDEYEDLMASFIDVRDPLGELLMDRRNSPLSRSRALRLLGLAAARKPAPLMTSILQNPDEPLEVRVQAAFALGRCRFRPSVKPLLAALELGDRTMEVTAIVALGEIGQSIALEPLLDKWDVRDGALREHLRLAARRVCPLNGSQILKEILDRNGSADGARIYFIDENLALFRGYNDSLVGAELRSRQMEARYDAVLMLSLFGGPADIGRMRTLSAEDNDLSVRELAAQGVRRLVRLRSQ